MAFLFYLLSLLFGFEVAPASDVQVNQQAKQAQVSSQTSNTAQQRIMLGGGGGDKRGGHGPIIVVEDIHFKMGD